MKIIVEFVSLPNIVRLIGSKILTLDFSGKTVNDLVSDVVEKYGNDVGRLLLDETGRLDMTYRVILNKQEWIFRDQMDRPLQDGDRVTIMLLVAGG